MFVRTSLHTTCTRLYKYHKYLSCY